MASTRRSRKADSWIACKRVLNEWPPAGVVALLQELYRLSDANRRFLHARLLAAEHAGAGVAETIKAIERLLTPQAVWNGRFKHAEIKRVIDGFARGAGDPAVVAEVLLADLAASLQTFSEVGDYEPMVDHIYATMKRLEGCLRRLDAVTAAPIVSALVALAEQWGNEFGWGVSDELVDLAAEWRERLGPSSR